jgi:hypothetical protein
MRPLQFDHLGLDGTQIIGADLAEWLESIQLAEDSDQGAVTIDFVGLPAVFDVPRLGVVDVGETQLDDRRPHVVGDGPARSSTGSNRRVAR